MKEIKTLSTLSCPKRGVLQLRGNTMLNITKIHKQKDIKRVERFQMNFIQNENILRLCVQKYTPM